MQNLYRVVLTFLVIVTFSTAGQASHNKRTQRLTDNSTPANDVASQFSDRPQTFQQTALQTIPQTMQIRVALPSQSARKPQKGQVSGGANEAALKGGLTQIELHRLAARDIVLLIDKSGSMSTPDCPLVSSGHSKLAAFSSLVLGLGGLSASRWDWCLEQTAHMAKQTEEVLANGFTVVLFESHFAVFPHVTVQELVKIFSEHEPGGGTDLDHPLAATFDDYFRRKQHTHGNVKPLLVGVITDGCPNNPNAVRKVIVAATRALRDPNEITVVFFLIGGHDRHGEEFVWDLSHNLVEQGAPYQIVKAVPFNELEKMGLARALANNLE
jgi:Mg-chelatase subunit ChlD